MRITHRCFFKKGSKGGLVSIFNDRMDITNSHNGKFILLPDALSANVRTGMIYECELLASRNDKSFVVTSAKLADDKLSLDIRSDKVFVCVNSIASDKYSYLPDQNSDYDELLTIMQTHYKYFEIVCARSRFLDFLQEFEAACKLVYKSIKKQAIKQSNNYQNKSLNNC